MRAGEATGVAWRWAEQIGDTAEEIQIAGALRQLGEDPEAEIARLTLVATPRIDVIKEIDERAAPTLWGQPSNTRRGSLLEARLKGLAEAQGLVRRWQAGRWKLEGAALPVDVVVADREAFGYAMIVETGPRSYVAHVRAALGQRGITVRRGALYSPSTVKGGPGPLLYAPTEADVLALARLPYLPPGER